ncbi:glycosyltransferase [Tessaracoccus sp. Z1128]
MRIAIVIDDFYPASGGIGRSVETQLSELTALGHEVTLIAPDRHLQKPRIGRIIECPTVYVEGLPAHLSILHCSDRRARLISDVARFDVVHSQTERGALVLGSKIAQLQGVPHLHTFHANIAGTHQTVPGSFFGTLGYQALVLPTLRLVKRDGVAGRTRFPAATRETGGLAARTDWRSFATIAQLVDGYTVPSPFMRELIEDAAGRPLRGYVVPTGYNRRMKLAIDAAPRERDDAVVRFLSVGRLAKEKRLDVLIKAFRRAALPNAELVIVGDGDQRDRLKALAAGCDRIDFRWHLASTSALAYEFRNADALVLSSYRFDSQALVIAEAVSAGLPVMYCDDRLSVGVSPESALLTGPDVASMAAGFRSLMDPGRRAVMSAATSGIVADLAPERTAERYTAAYTDLIERRARHG